MLTQVALACHLIDVSPINNRDNDDGKDKKEDKLEEGFCHVDESTTKLHAIPLVLFV
mgnify:CR=1 FL=1